MSILKDITKEFKVSKPVFIAELEGDGTCVSFIVESVPVYDVNTFQDPVAKLIAKRFIQQFSVNERRFVVSTHLASVQCDIVEDVLDFYEAHSPLKNPTQSKLYKWLRNVDNTRYDNAVSEGFIALYRYIKNSGGTQRCGDDTVRNVLAILEMMREKYEDKQ